jgi:hypothetical protein
MTRNQSKNNLTVERLPVYACRRPCDIQSRRYRGRRKPKPTTEVKGGAIGRKRERKIVSSVLKRLVIKANNRTVETLTCLRHVEGRAMSSSRRRKPKPTIQPKGGLEGGRESEILSVVCSSDSVIKANNRTVETLTSLRHVEGGEMSEDRPPEAQADNRSEGRH